MAILAHVLQVVGWWIAPLIVFLLRRESRCTSFHALQALLLQLLYMICFGVFLVLWFAGIFLTIAHTPSAKDAPPPVGIFVLMPLLWLFSMAAWALMLVVAIVYGIKAGRGEWAEYPVLGRLARKMLRIGPDGAPLPDAMST